MELTNFPQTSWVEKIIYLEKEKKSNVIILKIDIFCLFPKKNKKKTPLVAELSFLCGFLGVLCRLGFWKPFPGAAESSHVDLCFCLAASPPSGGPQCSAVMGLLVVGGPPSNLRAGRPRRKEKVWSRNKKKSEGKEEVDLLRGRFELWKVPFLSGWRSNTEPTDSWSSFLESS